MEKINDNRIDWISKARGLAILMVVAVHVAQKYYVPHITHFLWHGASGRCLFYIISGYLCFISLDRRYTILDTKSYFRYLLHKLIRFMPVLYLTVLFYIIKYLYYHEGGGKALLGMFFLQLLF